MIAPRCICCGTPIKRNVFGNIGMIMFDACGDDDEFWCWHCVDTWGRTLIWETHQQRDSTAKRLLTLLRIVRPGRHFGQADVATKRPRRHLSEHGGAQ